MDKNKKWIEAGKIARNLAKKGRLLHQIKEKEKEEEIDALWGWIQHGEEFESASVLLESMDYHVIFLSKDESCYVAHNGLFVEDRYIQHKWMLEDLIKIYNSQIRKKTKKDILTYIRYEIDKLADSILSQKKK